MVFKFPPPAAMSLIGEVNLTTNSMTIPVVPDVPLTRLKVTFPGGHGRPALVSAATKTVNLAAAHSSAEWPTRHLDPPSDHHRLLAGEGRRGQPPTLRRPCGSRPSQSAAPSPAASRSASSTASTSAIGEVIRGSDTVLTFEPHPLAVVRPEAAPKLLTSSGRQGRAGRASSECRSSW